MKTSWRYKLAQLKSLLGLGADIDTVAAYQYKLPREVEVEYSHADGWHTARIKKFDNQKLCDGFMTQGRTEAELIEMINDAVHTYLDIPPDISLKMPLLFPKGYTEKKRLIGKKLQLSLG